MGKAERTYPASWLLWWATACNAGVMGSHAAHGNQISHPKSFQLDSLHPAKILNKKNHHGKLFHRYRQMNHGFTAGKQIRDSSFAFTSVSCYTPSYRQKGGGSHAETYFSQYYRAPGPCCPELYYRVDSLSRLPNYQIRLHPDSAGMRSGSPFTSRPNRSL